MFILKCSTLLDAWYNFSDQRIYLYLLATYAALWISIVQDHSYQGTPTKVKQISSLDEWSAAIRDGSLVLYTDPSVAACTEYASIHAELSVSTARKLYLLDVQANPDLSKHAKVFVPDQPVLVMYEGGKESIRIPVESTKMKHGPINRHAGLSKLFWSKSVRSRFSL